MGAIVQSKSGNGTGLAAYTLTLDAAATNGNDIVCLSVADTQVHSGACTFGGANMTTDLDTGFGLWRVARFRVTAAGTACVMTLGGVSNWRGIILEVSGLDAAPLEATLPKTAVGGSFGAGYTCAYAAGAASRWGIVDVPGGVARTFTGANGATALAVDSKDAVVYKDALGSAAGSLDFTLNLANPRDFFGATYLNAAAPLVGTVGQFDPKLRLSAWF